MNPVYTSNIKNFLEDIKPCVEKAINSDYPYDKEHLSDILETLNDDSGVLYESSVDLLLEVINDEKNVASDSKDWDSYDNLDEAINEIVEICGYVDEDYYEDEEDEEIYEDDDDDDY